MIMELRLFRQLLLVFFISPVITTLAPLAINCFAVFSDSELPPVISTL
jgi:hypothetical protein